MVEVLVKLGHMLSRVVASALALGSASLGCAARDAGGSAAGPDTAPPVDDGGVGVLAPPDVGAPPEDAVKSESGLAWRVLVAGSGTGQPGINDAVEITYRGWTSDGTLFTRGDGQVAYVNRAIRGWTEALQSMTVGETRRLWVPPLLAYKGAPGAPTDTVVFDLKLDAIRPGPTPPADVGSPPADAVRLPDGLASKVVHAGTGTAHPGPDDGVRVKYTVWRRPGVLSDSSQGEAVVRPMSGDFPGWNEGLSQMVAGETRILWIPPALGPGPSGRGAPRAPALTAVIELVEILSPPSAPADVKRPPRGASVLRDGLASRVLTKGSGTIHPTKTDSVTVRFTGWTTDGTCIGSSYPTGAPATLLVSGDIPGFGEALQLMVDGEKRRVWIPRRLAYDGARDRPDGALVFDVELVTIGRTASPPEGPR
jgi:peptidylprolyl isomerase